jgi:hypothetical protein
LEATVRLRCATGWLALGLLTAAPVTAAATASLTCDAGDRHLSLELLGNLGSGPGAAIQLIGGTIKLNGQRGKFGPTEFKIEPGHLAGQWSFGRELRIGIMPEDTGKIGLYLVILAERTKGSDDLDKYRGEYVAQVTYPGGETQLKGKIKGCSAG